MAGLYFEEFEIGQVFDHEIRRTVLDSDNMMYSALTQPLFTSTTSIAKAPSSANR
jgi:acyl dehydratase